MRPRLTQIHQSGAAVGQRPEWTADGWVPTDPTAGIHKSSSWNVATAGNDTLTLAETPLPETLQVFVNGLLKTPGTHYTVSGDVVSFVTPLAGSDVVADHYWTTVASPGDSILSTVGATYSSEVLADSPLGYWRLGEASGTTMVDSSGNARDGTYTGSPTLGVTGLVTGDADTAVDFSGSGQYATVARSGAAWMDVTNITVEAIIEPDQVSAYAAIVYREDLGGSGGRIFQFQTTPAGKLEATLFNSGGSFAVATGATTLVVGVRRHVAFTFDGTTIKVFLDGVQDGSAALSGNLATHATENLYVGKTGHVSAFRYFDGTIDEVAYYGAALSSTRLLAHKTAAGL